jgi:hypothetical protein
MKKLIILILITGFISSSFSQSTAIRETPESEAARYFKEVYVESYFKDPYSYKLLKVWTSSSTKKIDPLIDSLRYYTRLLNVDSAIISKSKSFIVSDSIIDKYSTYEWMLLESQFGLREILMGYSAVRKKLGLSKTDSSSTKSLEHFMDVDDYKKLSPDERNIAADSLKSFVSRRVLISKEKIADIESMISKMPPTEKNKFVEHTVNLDCYAKNSYGNEVLGRYEMKVIPLSSGSYDIMRSTVIRTND